MFAELVEATEALDQVVGEIFRMRCGKANTVNTIDGIDLLKKSGKTELAIFLKTIGINILPDQSDLANALSRQLTDLFKDLGAGATDLSTPNIRNNTVATEIIAALHDRHKAGVSFLAGSRRKKL